MCRTKAEQKGKGSEKSILKYGLFFNLARFSGFAFGSLLYSVCRPLLSLHLKIETRKHHSEIFTGTLMRIIQSCFQRNTMSYRFCKTDLEIELILLHARLHFKGVCQHAFLRSKGSVLTVYN